MTTGLDAGFRENDPPLRLLAQARDVLVSGNRPSLSDRIGGVALQQQTPAALEVGSLQSVLARIESLSGPGLPSRVAGSAAKGLAELAHLPEPVQEVAYDAIAQGQSWSFAGIGIRRLNLPFEGEGRLELLRIEPGHGAPRHDHEGDEITLILTGAFHDGHRLYQAGDISHAVPGFRHQPVAADGEVCFALAVTYGDARFEGMLGLLQRITRH